MNNKKMPTHTKFSNQLQAIARNLCVGVIIISPWLIGSSDGWAYLLMCILTEFAAIMWLFSLLSQKHICLIAPKTLLAMLLFVAFTACQTLPLPQSMLRKLNPASAAIAAQESAVMESVSDTLTPLPAISDNNQLSTSPEGTNRALLLMLAFLSIFAVLSNTITTWSQLRRITGIIVFSGTIMAFIAIIHEFSGSEIILWIHQPRYGGMLYGPFTNHNHAVLHINMILGLALGLFLSRRNSRRDISQKHADARFGGFLLLMLALTILGGATCFSLSRGGIVSLMCAIGIVFMFAGNQDSSFVRPRLIASGFLIIAGLIWLGWEPVVNELGTLAASARDPLNSGRFVITKDTLKMFMDYPIFGCGFGTFQYLFPSYQSLTGYDRWSHAHNDWAQLTAEGGIIGAGLFLTAICLWGRYLQSCSKSSAPEARNYTIGTLVGILATAIYSFWEYGLHKPANGFLLMGLAGISIAAISMHEAPSTHSHRPHIKTDATPIPSGLITRFIIAGLMLLTAWQTGLSIQQFKGELAYTHFIYYQRLAEKETLPEKYESAVLQACHEAEIMCLTPIENPSALREISSILTLWSMNSRLPDAIRRHTTETGLNTASLAVAGSPSDYLAWVALARMYAVLNNWETAGIYLNHARKLAAPGMPVRMFLQKE